MRSRQTSIEALKIEEGSGSLRANRVKVLDAFRKLGPGTSAEVLGTAKLDVNLNLMRARVTELADAGWLVEEAARTCRATHRKAIVWRAIPEDATPVPREKLVTVQLSLTQCRAVQQYLTDGVPTDDLAAAHTTIVAAYNKFMRLGEFKGTASAATEDDVVFVEDL